MDLSNKYLLLDSFNTQTATPLLFDTLEEAQALMKDLIIEALGGDDEGVFDDYEKEVDYDWEPDADGAWCVHRKLGSSDWLIVSMADIVKRTEEFRQSQAEGKPWVNQI